jgi:hypothetical protein
MIGKDPFLEPDTVRNSEFTYTDQGLMTDHPDPDQQSVLWNRNRKNLNFLPFGTGTGTGTVTR